MISSIPRLIPLLLIIQALLCGHVASATGRLARKGHLREKQAAAMKSFVSKTLPASRPGPVRSPNITFSNPRAAGQIVVLVVTGTWPCADILLSWPRIPCGWYDHPRRGL